MLASKDGWQNEIAGRKATCRRKKPDEQTVGRGFKI
jgi:hypothetical protein